MFPHFHAVEQQRPRVVRPMWGVSGTKPPFPVLPNTLPVYRVLPIFREIRGILHKNDEPRYIIADEERLSPGEKAHPQFRSDVLALGVSLNSPRSGNEP